jgi:hypothetical protein
MQEALDKMNTIQVVSNIQRSTQRSMKNITKNRCNVAGNTTAPNIAWWRANNLL